MYNLYISIIYMYFMYNLIRKKLSDTYIHEDQGCQCGII